MFPAGAAARDRPAVRVDQLGYAPGEHKVALPDRAAAPPARALHGHRFRAARGAHGPRGPQPGAVEPALPRRPAARPVEAAHAGHATGSCAAGATSPRFRVADGLFAPRVGETVAFFQAQRDGANVIAGPLHRRPAHLNDAHATVYAPPRYDGPDSDVILGSSLKRDRRSGRRRGRMDRRRRLREVHAHDRLRRDAPVRRAARARRCGTGDAGARGAVRARLARQGVAARREHAPAGRHRLGQREGHLLRRPRPVAAAGEGRRA